MWIALNEICGGHCDVHTAIGKALCLCQNYEKNFAHVMMNIQLEVGLSNGEIENAFDQQWNSVVKKVKKWLLGTHVLELNKVCLESESVLEKLDSGRRSRNAIAHESSFMLSGSIRGKHLINDELQWLNSHVETVAKADHVVCVWYWQFNESEPPPITEHMYVKKIKDWVLSSAAGSRSKH